MPRRPRHAMPIAPLAVTLVSFALACTQVPNERVAVSPAQALLEAPPPSVVPLATPVPAVAGRRIRLEAGTFLMGSRKGDEDELPVVSVSVAAFELDETEVTVAAYSDCVRGGACRVPGGDHYCNFGRADRASHPINCVKFDDAARYCAWRGARLPTEVEWEYAARSRGRDILYPWGNAQADCTLAVMANDVGEGCGKDGTWPVCSKRGGDSAQGACDLAGNVWEWVTGDYCYYGTSRCTPGARVGRGGSWTNSSASVLRATNRNADDERFKDNNLGFRCAKSLSR